MIAQTPLIVDSVTVPGGNGRVGMVACPGASAWPATRSLGADIEAVVGWGAEGLVSLVEAQELEMLGVADLGARIEAAGLWWRHLPIRDMCAPDERFELQWIKDGERLRARLADGASIVIHCWAGLGRTGTIAARLLVELGTEPEEAIRLVREARPGAIQSLQQKAHVLRCRATDG